MYSKINVFLSYLFDTVKHLRLNVTQLVFRHATDLPVPYRTLPCLPHEDESVSLTNGISSKPLDSNVLAFSSDYFINVEREAEPRKI